MSSKSTLTNLKSPRTITESFWSILHHLRLLRLPNSSFLVSLFTLVTSVPHWDLLMSVPNGLISCSTSSLTKETWRKPKVLTSLWCVIELPQILLEVKLDLFSLSLCQFLHNLQTFAQISTPFNLTLDIKTSRNGKSELNLKKDKKRKKTIWKRSLQRLLPTAKSPRVSTPSKKSMQQKLITRKLSTSERLECIVYLYLLRPDLQRPLSSIILPPWTQIN